MTADNGPYDLKITGWGAMDELEGATEAGRDWLKAHFEWEPEPSGLTLLRQTGVAVNHSDIQDIIATAQKDGLKVRANFDVPH